MCASGAKRRGGMAAPAGLDDEQGVAPGSGQPRRKGDRAVLPSARPGQCVFSFSFLAPFCVRVRSPQGQGQLREPATPADQGLFAGCPRATHQWHLLIVRWVAEPRDGQLEERAGVCPERCERSLGFPALVQGLSSGCCATTRTLASPCPRDQSQERQGAAADSPANFNTEDNQAAAPSLPQFRVCGRLPGRGRGPVGGQPCGRGLAIPSNWAHDCGIHRDLSALPNGDAIGDNLYAASVARWYVQVEITEGDVRCDSGSRLFANACCCSPKGAGSAG